MRGSSLENFLSMISFYLSGPGHWKPYQLVKSWSFKKLESLSIVQVQFPRDEKWSGRLLARYPRVVFDEDAKDALPEWYSFA